ncbi:MAG: rhomboid family intramembrane serine protease [bacterium]
MLKKSNNGNAGRPTLCRACGAIVGAGQKQCAVCDAPVTTQPAARNARALPDSDTVRFARAVLDRPYKFTIILLIANLFVFLLMWQSSGLTSQALWEFPEPVLLAYGAKLNSLINQQHEWWRFVTPMFVHVNLPHVLINMYSLWVVGPYVEKLYGSAKFVVFWVLTGVAGVVASYLTVRPGLASGPGRFLFKGEDVLSAGASGALFGLVGVLFVFGIKFRHELPEGFKRAFGTGMLPIIGINLFIGYLGRGVIDNAAHLGGLASGALLALAVEYRRPGQKPVVATVWRVLQVAAIALAAISFIRVAQHFRDLQPASTPPQTAAVVDEKTQKFVAYAEAIRDAPEAFYAMLKDHDPTRGDAALKNLEAAPDLDTTANELKNKLKALLIKGKDIETKRQANSPQSIRDSEAAEHQAALEFIEWNKQYTKWLKTTGKQYGLIEVTETAPPGK